MSNKQWQEISDEFDEQFVVINSSSSTNHWWQADTLGEATPEKVKAFLKQKLTEVRQQTIAECVREVTKYGIDGQLDQSKQFWNRLLDEIAKALQNLQKEGEK